MSISQAKSYARKAKNHDDVTEGIRYLAKAIEQLAKEIEENTDQIRRAKL